VRLAGAVRFLDIAFPASLLALEIDGRLHETDRSIFESDRHRQNALVLAGWRVLRFTWAMLRDDPDGVVETVRAALATTSCRSTLEQPRY
jgi:very-short-patch-repair endonuclease